MSQTLIVEMPDPQPAHRRIDGSHAIGRGLAEPSATPIAESAVPELAVVGTASAAAGWQPSETALVSTVFEESPVSASLEICQEQLEHQAAQLSSLLQDQLRSVEHREAQLNARAAELDNELRLVRLRAQEMLAELMEREQAVAAQEAALAAAQREVASAREQAERSVAEKEFLACERLGDQLRQHEAAYVETEARQSHLDHREKEFARREQALAELEASLAQREQQLEEKEPHIRQRRQSIERESLRQELAAELSRREQALSGGEALLAEHVLSLDLDRQALARERADWQRQKVAEYETLTLQRQQAEVDLEQRRTRLAAREAAHDNQQAALKQLRHEITAAHRQSLEMRLMAEQLWGQIQGRLPPAEITQALAQLRLKLSEQYRIEQHGLAQQKEELLRLAEKVGSQSTTLRSQRQELQAWFNAREQEIERHAESLVRREQEVQDQSDRLRQNEDRWHTDRRQLEQQLRELHSQLRQTSVAA